MIESAVREHLGARVRRLRLERNISQAQLAEAIGMARTSITNIEVGRQGLVTPSFINIALYLGVEMADLLPTWGEIGAIHTPERERELIRIDRELIKYEPVVSRILALEARRKELTS